MRTTLTIDDDLAGMLKRRAQELGIPFKEMVNRSLRAGLGTNTRTARSHPVRTIPHAFGFKPGIDLDRMNQLVDDLEAESFGA